MRLPVSLCLLAWALSFPLRVCAQEVAGRLVVAVGDVRITRGAQTFAGQRGTEIRSGDTLQLGALSNAQILLTDGSIIALRPETVFRVTEYVLPPDDPGRGRSTFDLLEGGLRTVTGLIGKIIPGNYSVRTPAATIGIRGTHYSLVHCENGCRNSNGSLAPGGTYGGVTDGRIGVTNATGEQQFGHDEYFHVASVASAPERLIAPPGFLRDRLEGRARSAEKKAAAAQQPGASQVSPQGQQQQSRVTASADPSITASTVTSAQPVALTTNTFQIGNSVPIVRSPTPPAVQPAPETVFYRIEANCGSPPCTPFKTGEITLGINYAAARATVSVNVQLAGGGIVNYSTPAASGGIPITVNGNQATFSGSFDLANFPQSQDAFRCSQCGSGNTPGFASQLNFSGSVSGAQASITLSTVDPAGGNTLSVTLPPATPLNSSVAAMVLPNVAGGAEARSAAYWNVMVDGAGRLLDFGPLVGAVKGNVGTASNTIVGTAPGAGNLVWGTWGGGAQVTDFNYATFATTTTQPWITGDATSLIPPSLGTQTFTVIPNAWVINGSATNGVVNSGTLTADFVNRSINLSLNVTRTTGQLNTFQMNGGANFNPASNRFAQAFSSVTCSGPCTGPAPGGNFGGFFAGPQAQGAGVAFTAGNGTGNGVTGVVGMKR